MSNIVRFPKIFDHSLELVKEYKQIRKKQHRIESVQVYLTIGLGLGCYWLLNNLFEGQFPILALLISALASFLTYKNDGWKHKMIQVNAKLSIICNKLLDSFYPNFNDLILMCAIEKCRARMELTSDEFKALDNWFNYVEQRWTNQNDAITEQISSVAYMEAFKKQ